MSDLDDERLEDSAAADAEEKVDNTQNAERERIREEGIIPRMRHPIWLVHHLSMDGLKD